MELILKAKDIRVEFKGRDVLDINELEIAKMFFVSWYESFLGTIWRKSSVQYFGRVFLFDESTTAIKNPSFSSWLNIIQPLSSLFISIPFSLSITKSLSSDRKTRKKVFLFSDLKIPIAFTYLLFSRHFLKWTTYSSPPLILGWLLFSYK